LRPHSRISRNGLARHHDDGEIDIVGNVGDAAIALHGGGDVRPRIDREDLPVYSSR
jgi:hypothetical protein